MDPIEARLVKFYIGSIVTLIVFMGMLGSMSKVQEVSRLPTADLEAALPKSK